MRRAYFILLVVVTALTMIFALPSVALLAALFTFGLAALVLLPLPFICIGLWTLLPAAIVWRTPLRLPALALGACTLMAIVLMPPWYADRGLARDLATRDAIAATAVPLPARPGVEIRRRASPDPDLRVRGEGRAGALISPDPCGDLCERLLAGGQAAWVRVVLVDDPVSLPEGSGPDGDSPASHGFLVPGDAQACHAASPDLSTGPCALYARDTGAPADLVITLDEDRTDWHIDAFTPYQPMGYRTVVIRPGTDDTAPDIFRATQLFHDRPDGWILYDMGSLGNGDGGGGFMLNRNRKASEPIDLAGALETIGLRLGAPRPVPPKAPGTEDNRFVQPPPDAFDAALVASLIATGPPEGDVFTRPFANVVNNWHQRLRWKPDLSDGDRDIFCATLTAKSVSRFSWKDQVIKKHNLICPQGGMEDSGYVGDNERTRDTPGDQDLPEEIKSPHSQ